MRYMSPTELASASTDGTLRLWDLSRPPPAQPQLYSPSVSSAAPGDAAGGTGLKGGAVRTFRGHVNEKNFVGMSATPEFLACGSETNEVHVYLKALSAPVAHRAFDVPPQAVGGPAPPDGQSFISSVSWQPGTRNLVSANSQGYIKVLRLGSA